MADEYPASSPGAGDAYFQISSPLDFLRATIAASGPPGVQTSTSPSMSGDSAYAHQPVLPPNCWRTFLCQTILPELISRQARSPSELIAYSRSPSTVGVDRAPGYRAFSLGPTLPR